jgi:hypothetical protein
MGGILARCNVEGRGEKYAVIIVTHYSVFFSIFHFHDRFTTISDDLTTTND